MAKTKSTRLIAAAMAFAATPQGRKLLQQAKEYASKPENQARAQELLAKAKARYKGTGTTLRYSGPIDDPTKPPYGTPPKR